MAVRPINGFEIKGRRGHRCGIYYEEDRYTAAMYAVHKWRRQGFLDMDESSHLIDRIARLAGVGTEDTTRPDWT